MEISLQQYRISIGTYLKSGLPKHGNKLRKNKNNLKISKLPISQFFICLLIACLITNAAWISNHYMEPHCMESESSTCMKPFPQRPQEFNMTLQYVTWASSSCLSINKLCHILFGNRRNLGYKYFFWNCDRGFLSKNKIEDVKQVVSRHKPHFLGISEVDLTRNESISHDNESNNISARESINKSSIFRCNTFFKHDNT